MTEFQSVTVDQENLKHWLALYLFLILQWQIPTKGHLEAFYLCFVLQLFIAEKL